MTETKNLKLKTYETATDGQELVARYIDNTSDNFQKIDEFCKTDTTLSVEGGIADAKTVGDNVNQLKDDLATKIDKPSTAPEVGKILKVTAVNDDGTFVCEWANDNGGAVYDVQISGESIVQNGVANIPKCTNKAFGVAKLGNVATCGITTEWDGTLRLTPPVVNYIDIRFKSSNGPITPPVLDYAIKKAMCDGIGAAWTDTERIAALLRMGCTVDDNGFVKWGASE